jgi:hypothetical protein
METVVTTFRKSARQIPLIVTIFFLSYMFQQFAALLALGGLSLKYEPARKEYQFASKTDPSKKLSLTHEKWETLTGEISDFTDGVKNVEAELSKLTVNLDPDGK